MKQKKINIARRRESNPRNPQSALFKKLTKIFSGPLVNLRRQTEINLKKRKLEKYKSDFFSTSGQSFKRNDEVNNPFDMIYNTVLSQQSRSQRYADFEQMEFSPEPGSSLDLYADEMTTSTRLEPLLTINCSNVEIKDVLNNLFYTILNIEYCLHGWCRSMCKYGDLFLYLDIEEDYGVKGVIGLPPSEIERIEGEDPSNPNYVQYAWSNAGLTFENWQVSHFRILGNDKYAPYGCSVLDSARRVWRQLLLLEDAVMAYRIVRSPERRVFYIDVGNISPQDVEQYMQKVVSQMKRNQIVDPTSGKVDLRYNPLPVVYNSIIPLLDGSHKTIKEMAEDFDNGKVNWVYSIHDTEHQILPGKVVWCGKNYTAEKTYKVWLDDNTYIETAGEHPFLLRDGTKKRADELEIGDSLMPFYREKDVKGYERLYNPKTQEYVMTHKLVDLDVYREYFEKEKRRDGSRKIGYKNHKVLKIEVVYGSKDVYCMTVEGVNGEQDRHNFAICSKDINGNAVKNGVYVLNSTDEDFFIPVRGNTATRIETLPGGHYTGDIEDIKYLRDKLFSALKVPMSYLSRGEGADEDKSSLSAKDIRFARTIQRLQRCIVSELTKIGIIHLYILGFRGKDLLSFNLKMNNPSKIAELQELEHWKVRFDVASSATEGFFSRRWISEKLFNMSQEEFLRCQREMYFDRMMDAELQQLAEPPESMEGGGGGDFGEEIEGGGEETTPSKEEEEILLSKPPESPPPGHRTEPTITPKSKMKVYYPVKVDHRGSGARSRNFASKYSKEKSSSTSRNVFSGYDSLGRGISENKNNKESIYLEEEKKIINTDNFLNNIENITKDKEKTFLVKKRITERDGKNKKIK